MVSLGSETLNQHGDVVLKLVSKLLAFRRQKA
jgi:hypothetical protein